MSTEKELKNIFDEIERISQSLFFIEIDHFKWKRLRKKYLGEENN